MSEKAIVILSGGPDSTAAALWAIAQGYEVELVTFQFKNEAQYGELFSSMKVASALRCPHKIIDFKSPMHAFTPNMHIMMHSGVPPLIADKSKPYLMPFGSGTLLSFAASYALHEGISTVVWGATADDGAAHYEYSQAFCDGLAALIEKATARKINIIAPFSSLHKPEVIATYSNNPDLFSLTWSCRLSSEIQCGGCEGCTARRVSADLAGITDTSIYQSAGFVNPLAHFRGKALASYTAEDWAKVQGITPLECKVEW